MLENGEAVATGPVARHETCDVARLWHKRNWTVKLERSGVCESVGIIEMGFLTCFIKCVFLLDLK